MNVQQANTEEYDQAIDTAHDKAPEFAHKEFDISKLDDHEQPNLELSQNSHSLQFLAELLINNAYRLRDYSKSPEKSPLTVPQRLAIERYTKDLTGVFQVENTEDEDVGSTLVEDLKVIRNYLRLIDDLLFFSALGNTCEVYLVHKTKCKVDGNVVRSSVRSSKPYSIKITLYSVQGSRSERLDAYLESLLFELAGDYFEKYTCSTGSCRRLSYGNNQCAGYNIVCQVVPIVLGEIWRNLGLLEVWNSRLFRNNPEDQFDLWLASKYAGKSAREVYEQEAAIFLNENIDTDEDGDDMSTLSESPKPRGTLLRWLCGGD